MLPNKLWLHLLLAINVLFTYYKVGAASWSFPNLLFGLFATRRRDSQTRKEDHGRSIFTYPGHTIDVR